MVLILSSLDDLSTNTVIDWLLYYKKKYVRISSIDEIEFSKIIISDTGFDIEMTINNTLNICLSEITTFWYRRSYFSVFIEKLKNTCSLFQQINHHLQVEANILMNFFIHEIKTKSLNIPQDNNLNKLITLNTAAKLGLKVPYTLITNTKEIVENFHKTKQNIITKNISGGVFISDDEQFLSTITQRVTQEDVETLPEKFSYSLFQEEIKKIFELRIFYLDDNFYASAIFSQNDKKTEVDFRNYNVEKPNRTPPFKLPIDIEEKLRILMHANHLNSGSIDMIYSDQGEYIFLEINPIGQLHQVSHPCNYYLEKKIAEFL